MDFNVEHKIFSRVITIKKWWNLYFNDSVNIASYINYCNSNFEYNKALDKWIMPDGYLGLFIPTDDFEKRFAFVQTLV